MAKKRALIDAAKDPLAKKRAWIDAAQDPPAKKAPLPGPPRPVRKSHPVTIVVAFVVGVVGGFLMNRWLKFLL